MSVQPQFEQLTYPMYVWSNVDRGAERAAWSWVDQLQMLIDRFCGTDAAAEAVKAFDGEALADRPRLQTWADGYVEGRVNITTRHFPMAPDDSLILRKCAAMANRAPRAVLFDLMDAPLAVRTCARLAPPPPPAKTPVELSLAAAPATPSTSSWAIKMQALLKVRDTLRPEVVRDKAARINRESRPVGHEGRIILAQLPPELRPAALFPDELPSETGETCDYALAIDWGSLTRV